MTAEYLDRSSLVARMKYYEEHTTEGSGEHYAYSAALREIRNAPAADVAPVVRGKPITKVREVTITEYHEARGVFASDGSNVYIKNMVYAKVPYDHCPVCGAVLCSRWHNYCGKCGAKMDGGNKGE